MDFDGAMASKILQLEDCSNTDNSVRRQYPRLARFVLCFS